jgi:hypothetical protein
MACQRRRPAPGLVHHSDLDNQYRESLYQTIFSSSQGGDKHESEGQLLRQRAGGKLLQFVEERVGSASELP